MRKERERKCEKGEREKVWERREKGESMRERKPKTRNVIRVR